MDKARFKSMLALHGETFGDVAQLLGISAQSVSNKVNENHRSEFKQGEIAKIQKHYNLTAEEIEHIFFSEECPKKTQSEAQKIS